LDAEIVPFAALERAHQEAADPAEREHVLPYIYRNRDKFRVVEERSPVDLSSHRWTLDTAEDYAFIDTIYRALGAGDRMFGREEILAFLAAHPEVRTLNSHVQHRHVA